MKVFYFISTLILINVNASFSQEWASVGTTWTYTYGHIFTPEVSYNTIESIGDTVLNGQSCRILKSWKSACDLPTFGFGNFGHIYMYDQNDTVFFYNPDIDDFVVFYDFTAQAGDSWTTTMPESSLQFEFDFFEVFVDSTSTFEVAGQNLKALHVRYATDTGEDEYASTIVEYLGDLESMFAGYLSIASLCDAEYNRGIRCFENDEFGLINFVDFPCDSTWLISSTNEVLEEEWLIATYPSPVSHILKIDVNSINAKILIYNSLGQMIYQQTTAETANIDVADWESGIYIVEVMDTRTNVRKQKKIIVN